MKHLTVIDHETLAEAGLSVKEPVHACITCRFLIQESYRKLCGARMLNIEYGLNKNVDCKVWEARTALLPSTQSSALVRTAVTLSVISTILAVSLTILILAM